MKEVLASVGQRVGELVAIGFGTRMGPPRRKTGVLGRTIAFVEITRPLILLIGPTMVGAGAVLALNGYPPLLMIILGCLAVMISVSGIHSFNDWADRKRDLQVWPNRPVPSGRIKSGEALVFSLVLFTVALIMAYYIFNSTTFMVMLISIVLGAIYCLFARDRIGYLTLPLIVGLHPVGGWAAFSPETLFTRIEPWLLFMLAVLWQSGHIMVYSPGHPLRQIGGKTKTELPSLFYTPSPHTASIMGLFFIILTVGASIWLYFYLHLGVIYLVLTILGSLFVLLAAINLVRDANDQKRSLIAFNAATIFEVLVFGGILADIFFRTVVIKAVTEYPPIIYEFLKANLDIVTSLTMIACAVATAALVFAVFVICALTLLVINREPLKKIVEDLRSL